MAFRAHVMTVTAALSLAVGASAVPFAQVAACDCSMMEPEQAAAAADVAFTGTVVGEEPVPVEARAGMGFGDEVRYAFDVDGVAKGDVGSAVEILSGGVGAGCGMTFRHGERWLIFGTIERNALTTHLCAGNVALGPDEKAPIEVSAPSVSSQEQGNGVPLGVLAPVAVLLAVAAASGFLFWRAERPI
jgi:hypothetical protein